VEADSEPCFEGCGLWAKCGNRGRRTRLQWRLCRLDGGFGFGFSVAGVADPGRGAERLAERLLRRGPDRWKRIRSRVLRDVACGPSVETGADVPGYSGGFAAWMVVSDSDLL
jgi:hypothetical protein